MPPVKKTPKKERPEAKEKPAEKPSTKPAGKPAGASKGASGGAAGGFRGYLNETKLPVYSLMFVLPMVLFYEAAVVVVNRPIVATRGYEMRISADVLIRESMGRLLSAVGLGDFFMSGVLVAVVLVVWQIVSRKGWEVKVQDRVRNRAFAAVLRSVLDSRSYGS